MGRFLRNHPTFRQQKRLLALFLVLALNSLFSAANAEGLNIPIQRSVSTQPINTLEVVSAVKTLLNGRILSVKKKATYANPDCHLVKFLEDKGEFQLITVGCGMQTFAQNTLLNNSKSIK